MSKKFQEGQYVKPRLEGVNTVYRVCGYYSEKIVILEASVKGAHFTVKAHEDMLCLALNIDYIHTLPAEQMANWIMYRKNVCTPKFCKVEGDCSNAGCEKAVINFLNQPYDGWVVE